MCHFIPLYPTESHREPLNTTETLVGLGCGRTRQKLNSPREPSENPPGILPGEGQAAILFKTSRTPKCKHCLGNNDLCKLTKQSMFCKLAQIIKF